MTETQPTKRQKDTLNKIFGKGRLSDATIGALHSVGVSVVEISFPEGRKDKLRMSPDGMMLGHWRNI